MCLGIPVHIPGMKSQQISASATSARENSRFHDGKFGVQPHAEAEIELLDEAKVNEKFRRRTLELLQETPQARIGWRFAYPDVASSLLFITTFDLAPATGGTQLTTTMTWARRQGWQALLNPALLPVRRFLIWIKLTQISGSISRTFR